MSLTRDVEHNADTATLIATHLRLVGPDQRTVLDRMRDAQNGHPGAASWDGGPRSSSLWCFTHESDHLGADDDRSCPGLMPMPERTDPTATAAMKPDHAAADMRRINRLARTAQAALDEQVQILARYQWRKPTELEQARTTNMNDPHCESCIRIEIAKGVAWWVDPWADGRGAFYRTTVGDKLAEPLWLCRWCYDHVNERGCRPTPEELEQRRAGKRVHCKHPKVEQVA